MKTIWRIWVVIVSALAPAAVALAQNERYGNTRGPAAKPDVLWGPWIFAVIFLGAVAVVAFKNARRTHLD